MTQSGKIKRVVHYGTQLVHFMSLNNLGYPKVNATPTTVKLALTSRCNSRCVMCNYWKLKPTEEVTTEQYMAFLEDARDAGIKHVQFYGGEPLVRKDIFELIERTTSLGLTPTIITNGILLNEKTAVKLIENGIQHLTVSIQGLRDVHEKLMGVEGIFDKAVNGIKVFTREWERRKGTEPPVTITAVLMKPTLANENLQRLIELAEELGTDFCLNVADFNIPYFGVDGQQELNITEEDMPELKKLFDVMIEKRMKGSKVISSSLTLLYFLKALFEGEIVEKDIPCPLGFFSLYIDPEGNIHPCSVLKPVGNITTDRLGDIFESEQWKKVTHDMFFHKCPGCLCGIQRRLIFHFPSAWHELLHNAVHGRFSF